MSLMSSPWPSASLHVMPANVRNNPPLRLLAIDWQPKHLCQRELLSRGGTNYTLFFQFAPRVASISQPRCFFVALCCRTVARPRSLFFPPILFFFCSATRLPFRSDHSSKCGHAHMCTAQISTEHCMEIDQIHQLHLCVTARMETWHGTSIRNNKENSPLRG